MTVLSHPGFRTWQFEPPANETIPILLIGIDLNAPPQAQTQQLFLGRTVDDHST